MDPKNQSHARFASGLFLSVLLRVRLNGFFGVPASIEHVASRRMSMMRSLFVISRFVVLCSFAVVLGCVREMV
jgi:hypothetical protein